jgi:membrane protein YdbS with pleckstrin-like domain
MNALYEFARPWVLRVLRVPCDPQPPSGSPESLRVFRAGKSYYRMRLLLWCLRQVGVLVAFAFGLIFFHAWVLNPPDFLHNFGPFKFVAQNPEFVQRWHIGTWILVAEIVGLIIALLQIPFTYAMVRMDYEYRWYLVTDRSLRIRSGLTNIRETTFSYANIQQIVVNQGPLQRFLGLADVIVTTAGGGGGGQQAAQNQPGQHVEPLHQGIFHAVDNAEEIRDLITARLRLHRSAGLGEFGDSEDAVPPPTAVAVPTVLPPPLVSTQALEAARELLGETRALREALALGRNQP